MHASDVYFVVCMHLMYTLLCMAAPFIYMGMNSIVVYVGSETYEDYFPFHWKLSQTALASHEVIVYSFAFLVLVLEVTSELFSYVPSDRRFSIHLFA